MRINVNPAAIVNPGRRMLRKPTYLRILIRWYVTNCTVIRGLLLLKQWEYRIKCTTSISNSTEKIILLPLSGPVIHLIHFFMCVTKNPVIYYMEFLDSHVSCCSFQQSHCTIVFFYSHHLWALPCVHGIVSAAIYCRIKGAICKNSRWKHSQIDSDYHQYVNTFKRLHYEIYVGCCVAELSTKVSMLTASPDPIC